MFIQNSDAQLYTVEFGSGPRTILAHGGWIGFDGRNARLAHPKACRQVALGHLSRSAKRAQVRPELAGELES